LLNISSVFFLNLDWHSLPLDIGSIHSTGGDDATSILVLRVLVESDSGHMLGVPTDSSAVLSVPDARELVNIQAASVVGDCNQRPVGIAVDRIDISSIEADWENSHDLPSELASSRLPKCGISK